MQKAAAPLAKQPPGPPARARLRRLARAARPTPAQVGLTLLSALLLVLSFPDFDLWPLAWVALVPLMLATVGHAARGASAFLLGWLWGTLFFYGSCWWLTHSMIHYGGIPAPVAYLLLLPVTLVVGLFPGAWALVLARSAARHGAASLLVAPFAWAAFEWARLAATGQLWNAVGYSQAYQPALIQTAAWGGVYAVGFLIVSVNAAVAYAVLRGDGRALLASGAAVLLVCVAVYASARPLLAPTRGELHHAEFAAVFVAVQPNVSPDFDRPLEEEEALVARHLQMSAAALAEWDARAAAARGEPSPPRVVVWPESPMNFRYARDARFRETVAEFARANRASVLFNALEPAPAGGAYNSAVLVDERGQLVAQYDKIRLLPFGEYVPLPWWLGGGLVGAIVGEFTPGASYTLLPAGEAKAGVFICFESAFPALSREFAGAGADVLINISNDGYLGRTPVLRQHLANTIFRAVENRRTVLRVTNTGITARITPRGRVVEPTDSFQTATRLWPVGRDDRETFYTRRGDLFVALCAIATAAALAPQLRARRNRAA